MRIRLLTVLALLALVIPSSIAAQATGDIQATAVVLAPLTVTPAANLDFGNVIPGVNSTLLPSDANAGRFDVAGSGVLEVTLDFTTLPNQLATGGGATMPILYGAGSAAYADTPAGAQTTFDPSATATTNLVAGALSVFLGGTVQPAFNQAAGSYSATVTLQVAYTGN